LCGIYKHFDSLVAKDAKVIYTITIIKTISSHFFAFTDVEYECGGAPLRILQPAHQNTHIPHQDYKVKKDPILMRS